MKTAITLEDAVLALHPELDSAEKKYAYYAEQAQQAYAHASEINTGNYDPASYKNAEVIEAYRLADEWQKLANYEYSQM